MRGLLRTTAVLLCLGNVCAAYAQPTSDEYAIERIVQPSAFHGVHGLAFDAAGTLFAGSVAGQTLYRVDVRRGSASIEVGPPEGMADDLTFLSDGTLVWTSINAGVIRARTGSETPRTIASGLPGINSLAERKSDHRLFAAQVFAGDGLWEIDPTGQTPARQILANIGGLNGFDIGSDGMIYGPLWFKHQIARIDPDTGALSVITDDFGIPAAANFDSHGNLYVVDTQRGELAVVDVTSGSKRVVAKLSSSLDNLAIDARDRIFVSNMADNGIQEVNPRTGQVHQIIKGTLAIPNSIAALPRAFHDEIFVADLFAFRELDTRTRRVRDLARVWAENTPITYAINVSVAAPDHVTLVNTGGTVQRWDARTRTVLTSWTVQGAVSALELGDGSMVVLGATGTLQRIAAGETTPTALAFNLGGYGAMTRAAEQALYLVNLTSGTLYYLDVSDGTNRQIATGLQGPQSLAVLPSGEIVVAEGAAGQLSLVDPNSGATRVIASGLPLRIPNSTSSAVSVTVGSGGTIYVTSAAENSIYQLRPRCRR
jgi:sugar lactone lactonase YvrE